MSSFRVGEPVSLAEVAENGLSNNQKKKVVLLYILIPHPVHLQRPLLDLSGEGLEVGAEGLEEAEVCLHVRESAHQGSKAGVRLLLHQE